MYVFFSYSYYDKKIIYVDRARPSGTPRDTARHYVYHPTLISIFFSKNVIPCRLTGSA